MREKLAVCDVTNLPYMGINWQYISIYGDFVTSLTAYYSCADISMKIFYDEMVGDTFYVSIVL